ncbi:MAG: DEAD/DEAH box helicase family protein [Bacteroidales bacterium]|nr:DEAD/DEAH box helicase family protein [Bacteroidales bacterium]
MESDLKPEEKARKIIDKQLESAGWHVVDRNHISSNDNAYAVTEQLLNKNKEADYMLFLESRAIGVVEAKREEIDVETNEDVKIQVIKYAHNVPNWVKIFTPILPLAFVANGKKILFKDVRNHSQDFKIIKQFPSPYDIVSNYNFSYFTNYFAGLPYLKKLTLRNCQYNAVINLENSFHYDDKKRALLSLTTGAGKTFTACMIAYRFLSFTKCKKVLFLVDRNNLSEQTLKEFNSFDLTDSRKVFSDIFCVERLKANTDVNNCSVIISTIQRLFSFISGKNEEYDDSNNSEVFDNDDDNIIEFDPNTIKIPKDFFDLIIIDECHRSIYGKWRKVLDYFSSAYMIGLTATPEDITYAFFDKNCAYEYSFDNSVLDNVNVDSQIYRIKTKETEEGGIINKGEKIEQITNYTGEQNNIKASEDIAYFGSQLNRSVINYAQIKLILQEYKNIIYTKLYPNREPDYNYIPKTLIFAVNDKHADNIVKIANEVFEKEENSSFAQKITCTAGDSVGLIKKFREEKSFRIAVTVTLVSTGTDIKPLEVVMFMRDVMSKTMYIQMKGRGCRVIDDRKLRNVTPNASEGKNLYYIVDAIGVTEHEKNDTTFLPPNQVVGLERLFELIINGNLQDEYLHLLAGRLSRIAAKANAQQLADFEFMCKINMKQLASNIYEELDNHKLPPFVSVNEDNKERKTLVRPITASPEARELLLEINAGYINILKPGNDELLYSDFSQVDAEKTTNDFKNFVTDQSDKIEALRIIYNNTQEAITQKMLFDLQTKMIKASHEFNTQHLWDCYSIIYPEKVTKFYDKSQVKALTNIIQLVRFALNRIDSLHSISSTANQYFELFCGKRNRNITPTQRNILSQVVNHIISNGYINVANIREYQPSLAMQFIQEFNGAKSANETLYQLAEMLISA